MVASSVNEPRTAGRIVALCSVLAIACAVLCGGPAAAGAASHAAKLDIHVAPWGNDAWQGTQGRPFKTLQRARQAVRARTAGMKDDIVVNIHRGTYRLTAPLRLTDADGDSGRNGHRVIWQAYRDGKRHQDEVVISGGRTIDGWKLVDPAKNIWRANVGALETRQLFVDGVRAGRAVLAESLPDLTRTATGFTTSSTAPQSWSRPQDVEFVFTGAFTWSEPRCGVASVTSIPTGTAITMDQPCFKRLLAVYGGGGFPGVGLLQPRIENSKSFLARPGSFYLDRTQTGGHVLYYVPRSGENLRRDEVVAPVLESLVEGTGTDAAPLRNVTFRGLTFADATWLQPSTDEGFVHYIGGLNERGDGPTILAVTLSPQAESMPGNVIFRRVKGIVFERNQFERLGAQALELVGSDSVVRGNVVTNVSGGGILIGDDRPQTAGVPSVGDVVEDNWIHGVGVEYQGGTGIWATRTTNLTVAHNQVNDMPYSGIVVGQGHEQKVRANGPQDPNAPRNVGARVLANHVFDFMKVLHDGGGIYTTFKHGTSWDDAALIKGNVVHDMQKPYWAIYTDWGSSWERVQDNVLYDFVYGSTGGCSFVSLGAQIAHMEFTGNFWTDNGPQWLCGPVLDVTVTGNTQLPADDAAAVAACSANARCAEIVRNAGLEPAYRDLVS